MPALTPYPLRRSANPLATVYYKIIEPAVLQLLNPPIYEKATRSSFSLRDDILVHLKLINAVLSSDVISVEDSYLPFKTNQILIQFFRSTLVQKVLSESKLTARSLKKITSVDILIRQHVEYLKGIGAGLMEFMQEVPYYCKEAVQITIRRLTWFLEILVSHPDYCNTEVTLEMV